MLILYLTQNNRFGENQTCSLPDERPNGPFIYTRVHNETRFFAKKKKVPEIPTILGLKRLGNNWKTPFFFFFYKIAWIQYREEFEGSKGVKESVSSRSNVSAEIVLLLP